MFSKKRRKWFFLVVNTLVMVLLTFLWMNQPRTYGDEAFFVKWLTITKRTILNIDDKPPYKDFLFVDVSESKTLLPLTPDSSRVSIISDRKKLAELCDFVGNNNSDIRLLVCDVLFNDTTVHDKNLENAAKRLGKKFLGVNEIEDGSVIEPIIDIPHATSSIYVEDGTIIKYPILLENKFETVPAEMLHLLDNQQITAFPPIAKISEMGYSLGSPILELSVRENDFIQKNNTDSVFVKIGLGEMVNLIRLLKNNKEAEKQLFNQYFKNKIILIGDFENDRHNTVYGSMSGTLIILNAYLTLKHGKSLISIGLLLFLLFGFGIISYTFFIDNTIRIRGLALNFLEHQRGIIRFVYYYGLFLTGMTIIVYYVFGIHVGIFFHLLYLKIIDWIYQKKYLEWYLEIQSKLKKWSKIFSKITLTKP